MGACLKCGKKGFLVHVDEKGFCKKCRKEYEAQLVAEEARQKEIIEQEKMAEEARANSLLDDICNGYVAVTNLSYPSKLYDSENKEENISFLNSVINELNRLICISDEISSNEHMCSIVGMRLKDEIKYRDARAEKIGCGSIPRLGITTVWTDRPIDWVAVLKEFKKNLENGINRINEDIARIYNLEKERLLIDNLPSFNITPCKSSVSDYSISDLLNLRLSKIDKWLDMDLYSDFITVAINSTSFEIDDDIFELAAVKFKNWKPVEKFDAKFSLDSKTQEEKCSYKPDEIMDSFSIFTESYAFAIPNLLSHMKLLYKYGYNMLAMPKRRYYDILKLSTTVLKTWDQVDREEELYSKNPDIHPCPDFESAVDNFSVEQLSIVYDRDMYGTERDCVDIAFLYGQLFYDVVYHIFNSEKERREL